jgi:hypothetical protein
MQSLESKSSRGGEHMEASDLGERDREAGRLASASLWGGSRSSRSAASSRDCFEVDGSEICWF